MDRRDAIISLAFTAAVSLVALVGAVVSAVAGAWVWFSVAVIVMVPLRRPTELRRLVRIARHGAE